jgi:hypothetical protein
MEETGASTPKAPKKIRLTRAEAYAMRLPTPRKKKLAFGLIGLLIAAALGNVLWHFQDLWLFYWLPEKEPAPPVVVKAAETPKPPAPASAPVVEPQPPAAPGPELDFLSAAVWDDPQFLQGVRMFNQALDQQRLFLHDRAQPALLAKAEEGALQAAQVFAALKADAPANVPLGDYVVRCQTLVVEVRRLRNPPPAAAAGPKATPRPATPPPRPGEAWQDPDYLEGARLFNQALEQYKFFLADKSRTERLKPIEDAAFQAAKKFEALKGVAPTNVPLGDHITQCYKLISDCRRQNLEGATATPDNGSFDRGTAGPSRRPPLPAYQPPQ